MAGADLPQRAIREQIASALDVVVQISRLKDGSRKIINVTEVQGMEGEQVVLQDVFVFEQTAFVDGKIQGRLRPTGIRPKFSEKFEAAGIKLPQGVFGDLSGQKVEFQFRGAYLPCKTPSWLIANDKLYGFTAEIDGNKLLPFLNKKAISVSRKLEDTYYRKFVAPLVASFDVKASGFEIITQKLSLVPVLNFSEILMAETVSSYDEEADIENYDPLNEHIAFELSFNYGNFTFKADSIVPVSVEVDEKSGNYYFYRIPRQMESEKKYVAYLKNIGLELLDGTTTLQKLKAFTWLNQNKQALEDIGFRLEQAKSKEKKYFIGKSSISFEIRESIDWFDIYALIRFGEFEIPFNELRRIVMLKGNEITLPNGEIAVIPESWLIEYSELFAFVEDAKTNNSHTAYHLKKYHLALVKELEKGNLAKVSMSRKLEKLRTGSITSRREGS